MKEFVKVFFAVLVIGFLVLYFQNKKAIISVNQKIDDVKKDQSILKEIALDLKNKIDEFLKRKEESGDQ